jgi:outer membrane protein assembly factor BamD
MENSYSAPTKGIQFDFQSLSAAEIYANGKDALENHQYEEAAAAYKALNALHPLSPYAEQAYLNLLYSCFQTNDMDAVTEIAHEFIRFYPQSAHIDYAHYLKALAHFNQKRGWFVYVPFISVDISQRDPGKMVIGYRDLNNFITAFPDSAYVKEAQSYILYLRTLFARHELKIAGHYLNRDAYAAAVARAQYVRQNYPELLYETTKALEIIEIAHHQLGFISPKHEKGFS